MHREGLNTASNNGPDWHASVSSMANRAKGNCLTAINVEPDLLTRKRHKSTPSTGLAVVKPASVLLRGCVWPPSGCVHRLPSPVQLATLSGFFSNKYCHLVTRELCKSHRVQAEQPIISPVKNGVGLVCGHQIHSGPGHYIISLEILVLADKIKILIDFRNILLNRGAE